MASRLNGAALLVDATANKCKVHPDSFTATVPIWCAVMNRLVLHYRSQLGTLTSFEKDDSGVGNDGVGDDGAGDHGTEHPWNDLEAVHQLHTHQHTTADQREGMEQVLHERVKAAIDAKVILNPKRFVKTLDKPLKCLFFENPIVEYDNLEHVHHHHHDHDDDDSDGAIQWKMLEEKLKILSEEIKLAQQKYSCIVCISCSNSQRGATQSTSKSALKLSTHQARGNNVNASSSPPPLEYIAGAGDDEESWARGMTPFLYWDHIHQLVPTSRPEEWKNDEDKNAYHEIADLEKIVDDIVQEAKHGNEEWFRDRTGRNHRIRTNGNDDGTDGSVTVKPPFTSYFDTIGATPTDLNLSFDRLNIGSTDAMCEGSLSIGTRRAGRPPECWQHFDIVINVTTMEYEELSTSSSATDSAHMTVLPGGKLYLQLPVKEGKRDKTELEKWLPLTMLFIGVNLCRGKRILIHCAQGQDRSVAVVMAALCLFYDFLVDPNDHNNGNHDEVGGIQDGSDCNTTMRLHSWCSMMS